jgi:D-amino-acid oxidase
MQIQPRQQLLDVWRPQRSEIRLEHVERDGRHVVHNYGHSGAGVSLSWGCADRVLEIVRALVTVR